MSIRSSHARLLLFLSLAAIAAGATGCRRAAAAPAESFLASGDAYRARHKYAEAIVEYRHAIEADPRLAAAHTKLAAVYTQTGNPSGARRELVAAADLLPQDVNTQLEAGLALLRGRQFEDAKARAFRAMAFEPNNVAAYILEANAAAGLRDFESTLEEVTEAIRIDPANADSCASLGTIELPRARNREAEAAFKRTVEMAPESVLPYLALANFFWATGRVDAVEAPLLRAIELDRTNAVAQRALASWYLATGRMAEAEAPLKIVAGRAPDGQSRLMLADYYLTANRVNEGRTLFEALATEPDGYIPAMLALAGLDRAERREKEAYLKIEAVQAREPKNAQAALAHAQLLLAERKIEEALAQAQTAVASEPASATARYMLGTIHQFRNEDDEAIRAFNEALALNPRVASVPARLAELQLRKEPTTALAPLAGQAAGARQDDMVERLVLARTIAAKGELTLAESILTSLVAERPAVASLHEQLGRVRLGRKDTAGARRAFTRALELDVNAAGARRRVEAAIEQAPVNTDLLVLAGVVYAAGDPAEQERVLRRAIEIDPATLEAFATLATLYVRTGRLEEARAEFTALAARQPTSIAASTMVAFILERQNKPVEAQRVYEHVLAVAPGAAVAAKNLAAIYAETGGNLDVATRLAQMASQQLPARAEVSDTLGRVYLRKGLANLAIQPLLASVEIDPRNASYRYHLGLAYLKIGETEKARDAFEVAMRLEADVKEAHAARQALLLCGLGGLCG